MRNLKIASLFSLVLILTALPLFARDKTTRFSTVKGMYQNQTLQIPAGTDIEGYTYLGMLISRYESTTPNSAVPTSYLQTGSYTKRVEVDGNQAFFVPYAQATGTTGAKVYNLNYNSASVKQNIFSTAPELEQAKLQYVNLDLASRVFSLEWYHIYRTPEGRIMAVGRDFEEYSNPYRTFFKVGPQTLEFTTSTGTYDADTATKFKLVFSEAVDIKGQVSIKFKGYPSLVTLPTTFTSSNVVFVEDTIKLPADFPETTRTQDLTTGNLINTSAKVEYIVLGKGTGNEKYVRSTITGLNPQGYDSSVFTSSADAQLNPYFKIGDAFNNSLLFDMSRPTISLVDIALTSKSGKVIPNQTFDSTGIAITKQWFNNSLVSVLGKYTDSVSGPVKLSILNSTNALIKSGTIPNPNITNNKTKPPYDIAQKATVSDQRAVLNLTAREIRNSLTQETLFEDEVVLKAKVEDMAYDSNGNYHSEVQTFRAYIDLYPPEIVNAVVQTSGQMDVEFESRNSKIKKIEMITMNSKAYKKALDSGKWEGVPEFYIYSDGYNHGADTLEAFADHLTGGMGNFPASTFSTKKVENVTTPDFIFEESYLDMDTPGNAYLLYRTEDELGNVGYGHLKMTILTRGAPFLTEIDTPEVNQYFSNLAETNNSVITLKARTIDMALGEPKDETDTDNIRPVTVLFNLYRAEQPSIPIVGIENIELGTLTLTGPKWEEFEYTIDLKNYITEPTTLDGALILEVWSVYVDDDTLSSVPARVPINVHSVKPSLTHISSVANLTAPIPRVTIKTTATSAIPLYGTYNSIGDSDVLPPFVYGSANANPDWTKIEAIHTQELENLNGTIYYKVVTYDKAQNKATLLIGPIAMYSDLESYITSSKQTAYTGVKTNASTPTLILTDTIDNSLIHVTSLNSDVQMPLLNLNVKVIDSSTSRTMNSGNSASTSLELPFVVRNVNLDYKKYLADYTLSTGLDITSPVNNRTSEVYTIINPIQSLFDISLSKNNTTLTGSVKLKASINSDTFPNSRTLRDLVTNSRTLFGIDLEKDLMINVGKPVSDITAKPFTNANSVTFTMGANDYIAIGYRGKGNSPDYELRFYWDTDLANAQITNVPNTLVQASSSYEIQLKATHLGETYTLPANMPQVYLNEFKTSIMIIPTTANSGINYSATAETNWNNLKVTYGKDYTIEANRKVASNGQYDIIIEVITPFKIKCYDYKRLNLLLMDKDDYLTSENNQAILISRTTVLNNLSRKLVNHSINVTKASEVGAYQLQNGNIIVYSKLAQTGTNTVLEIYDSNFNLVKKLDAQTIGSFSRINDVLEVKNLILLGTNAGLFSINESYTGLSRKEVSGFTLGSTEVYQLESFSDAILLGVNSPNTLVMAKIPESELQFDSSRSATELFVDSTKRVRKLQVRNSSIYVTYDSSTNDAVKYTVLE